jgi:hypothetical protein
MPVVTWVDHAAGVRHIAFTGVLTDGDVAESYWMVADPDGDPAMDLLVETSGVERVDVTEEALRAVAGLRALDSRRPAPAPARVAVVAPADVMYNSARMYGAYRQEAGAVARYFVCRTMEEARRWLGLGGEGKS